MNVINEEDFTRAFEETMLHFKRTGKAKGDCLNEILPAALGYFEMALKDKFSTEKMLKTHNLIN